MAVASRADKANGVSGRQRPRENHTRNPQPYVCSSESHDASLQTGLRTECSRCLRPMEVPVDVTIEEEFLPALDMATGKPLPADVEPDVARLTDHHEINLEPLVRDELVLAEPIAPLHSPDCAGLCVECGLPLDEGTHDHPTDDIDPRLEALRSFKPDDTTD
jgi:uncharacterized protein